MEQRLTKFVEGAWVENHDNDQRKGWKNGNRACMTRLAEYENTGLQPVEVESLKLSLLHDNGGTNMNANCLDEKGRFKACPYRVITEEHKAIAIGTGDVTIQAFYPCVGEHCIAYHVGLCMRVQEALKEVK